MVISSAVSYGRYIFITANGTARRASTLEIEDIDWYPARVFPRLSRFFTRLMGKNETRTTCRFIPLRFHGSGIYPPFPYFTRYSSLFMTAASHEAACNRHFHAIATRSDFCLCLKKKACPLSPIFFLSFLSWIEPPKEIRESHGDSPADNNSTDRILAFVSAPLSIPLSREISGSVAGALRGISRANCRKFYEPLDSCNFCLGSPRMIIEHAGRARYRDVIA